MDSITIQSEEISLGPIQGTHLNMYCCPKCKYTPSLKMQDYGRTEIQCSNCHYGPKEVPVKEIIDEIQNYIRKRMNIFSISKYMKDSTVDMFLQEEYFKNSDI